MAPADDSSKTRIAGGDAGQGAHKPSEKHALDDVLKSLQDLIRNELLEVQRPPAPRPPSADPSIPRKRGRPRKPLPPEPPALVTPPPLEPAAEVEAVRSTLEHLVEHELNPDEATTVHDSATATEAPVPAAEPVEPRGDQHEFSFDLGGPASPAPEETGPGARELPSIPDSGLTVEPETVPEHPPASEAVEEITLASDEPHPPEAAPQAPVADHPTISELEEEFTLATPPADESADTGAPPEIPVEGAFIEEQPAETDSAETLAHELAFDDIPVLQDMVAPPPPGSHARPADVLAVDSQKLRDLSIRAVARLNIELRKRGETPLDAKLIDRLQGLLREELEKSTKGGK
jgi:hypothetical protein